MLNYQGVTVKGRDFGEEAARILPSIMREFTRRQKDIFSQSFLTLPQIVLLDFLFEQGASQMSELAKALNFTLSAATAVVDKMVRQRLIKREHSSEDRRVVRVSLLNKGKQLARQVRQGRRECANELFSALSEQEKNEYIRMLKKAYLNLTHKENEEK
ncbi:MAG: MarR family transcriptional regulator [Candidatus Omnitrophica bacterium]|nr:MarR family transcriptional regulator [Candidatus Omnitrophota bacterium]